MGRAGAQRSRRLGAGRPVGWIGEGMIQPWDLLLQRRIGDVALDHHDTIRHPVERRVPPRQGGQAGVPLHGKDMQARDPRHQAQKGGPGATAAFQHRLPRARGNAGGQQDGIQPGAQPLAGLEQAHAAIEEPVLREKFGFGDDYASASPACRSTAKARL